jgi:hypothetical protein
VFQESKEQALSKSDSAQELSYLEKNFKEELEGLVKPVEKQVAANIEQYVFAFDTLNQDRPIQQKDREQIIQYLEYFS